MKKRFVVGATVLGSMVIGGTTAGISGGLNGGTLEQSASAGFVATAFSAPVAIVAGFHGMLLGAVFAGAAAGLAVSRKDSSPREWAKNTFLTTMALNSLVSVGVVSWQMGKDFVEEKNPNLKQKNSNSSSVLQTSSVTQQAELQPMLFNLTQGKEAVTVQFTRLESGSSMPNALLAQRRQRA